MDGYPEEFLMLCSIFDTEIDRVLKDILNQDIYISNTLFCTPQVQLNDKPAHPCQFGRLQECQQKQPEQIES